MLIKNILKFLYGFLFVIIIPLFLIWWTSVVQVPFKPIRLDVIGTGIIIIGFIIIISGFLTLISKGKGLPMNAFPPERLVTTGIYAIIPHPIYFGFILMCPGLSLKYGSATGLYLTTPIVFLSCFALALGYENPYLLRTFGRIPHPVLSFSLLMKPFIYIFKLDKLWYKILRLTERTANSWHEHRIGSIRIISHGKYAGLSGGIGVAIIILLSGKEHIMFVSILCISGIIGAALVGQLLVGKSNKLSRPFGYFGSVLGIAISALLILPFEKSLMLLLAAFSCAAPLIQGIGRIRCLIQGCCHGSLAPEMQGIKIHNTHSRVCALANLSHKSIYPTQLYSIIGNIFACIVMAWLWASGISITLITGIYLILAGIVRFIEEGHRGEPLTRIIGGLHIYQWFAILSVIIGMMIMLIPGENAPKINPSSIVPAIITGVIFFLICWFVYGIDFPESNKRFSRLSG